MLKFQVINKLYEVGAMAIVRVETMERACEIADGLIAGGLPVMEISYTLANAGEVIEGLKNKYKDNLLVGAGTVLDSETARLAILKGAEFIIAPNFSKEVALLCNRYQVPYCPGCTSVNEMISAMEYGASFIKAFPISNFYSYNLVKVLKTPIPNLPILASGGIDLDNIDMWVKSGVDCMGLGGLLTKDSKEEIAANAKKVREAIKKGRP